MSTFSTGIGMLALAAIGMASWQANRGDTPSDPLNITVPSDPVVAAALPGITAIPARIASEPEPVSVILPDDGGQGGNPCGLQVMAEAVPPAMIALQVEDACRPRAEITIRHEGLVLSSVTDTLGRASILVPAFSDPARIEVAFPDGAERGTTVNVPDLVDYHRAAIVWQGADEFRLQAHERGAADGTAGHIDASNPGRVADAVLGAGGYLSLHGSGPDAARAQVHTYPRDTLEGDGQVRLSVRFTPSTCGAQSDALSLQLGDDQDISQIAITVTAPDCAASQQEMMLQNIFEDLRIAQR